jgi:hypothetical protein
MFLTSEVKRFFEAWQALRAGETVPHYRVLFEALAPDLIPGMMLLEESAGERYIVRFMGTALVEFWGGDLTGQDRFAAMPPKAAATAERNLHELLAVPCGATAVQPYGAQLQHEAEIIVLPVGNDPGKPRRLACFAQDVKNPLNGGPAGGPRNTAAVRYQQTWVDLGFGLPARPPAPVFRR